MPIFQGTSNSGKTMIVGNDGNLICRDYCYVFEFDIVTYDGIDFNATAREGATFQNIVNAFTSNKNVYFLGHINTGADVLMQISETNYSTYIAGCTTMMIYSSYFSGVELRVKSDNTIEVTVTILQPAS